MSNLIDRQAAMDALGELATFTEDWSCHTWMYTDDVYNAIKQLPPIQPKIVRCGECTYHYQRNCPIEKYFSIDGFCSRGKRREVTT